MNKLQENESLDMKSLDLSESTVNETHLKQTQIKNSFFKELLETILNIYQVALPIISGRLLEDFIWTVQFHFLGLLDDKIVTSALGTIILLISCAGGYFINGVNSGFGILVGRCQGLDNTQIINNYFTKAFIQLCALFSIFLMIIFNSHHILVLLQQRKDVAEATQYYFIRMIPGLFSVYLYDLFKNYLNAQKVYSPPMIIQALIVFTHFVLSVLLVGRFGFTGIIFAYNLANLTGLSGIILYMYKKDLLPSLVLDSSVFNEFTSFCQETLTMAIPNEIDMIFYEQMSFVVGSLKKIHQFVAYFNFQNIVNISYSIPYGIGGSIGLLISNQISDVNTQKVKMIIISSLVISILQGFTTITIVLLFQDNIVNFFTQDPIVQAIMLKLINVYKFAVILDHLNYQGLCILNSLGKSHISSLSLFSGYFIGIPTGIYLGLYLDYGVCGIWFGYVITLGISGILIQIYLLNVDLEEFVLVLSKNIEEELENLELYSQNSQNQSEYYQQQDQLKEECKSYYTNTIK